MVVLEERQTPLTLVLAEAVAHLPLEETELNHQVAALLREMEETALHLLFLARLQLTQAVVVAEYKQQLVQQVLPGLVELVVVETEQKTIQMPHLELPILAVAEVAVVRLLVLADQAAQAVLALSSSSTTSALPQSSPSSHRRSGLHQRVR